MQADATSVNICDACEDMQPAAVCFIIALHYYSTVSYRTWSNLNKAVNVGETTFKLYKLLLL